MERNDLLGHLGKDLQDPHRWRLPQEFEVEVLDESGYPINIHKSSKHPGFQSLCENVLGQQKLTATIVTSTWDHSLGSPKSFRIHGTSR